jgi:hypothetical protein
LRNFGFLKFKSRAAPSFICRRFGRSAQLANSPIEASIFSLFSNDEIDAFKSNENRRVG